MVTFPSFFKLNKYVFFLNFFLPSCQLCCCCIIAPTVYCGQAWWCRWRLLQDLFSPDAEMRGRSQRRLWSLTSVTSPGSRRLHPQRSVHLHTHMHSHPPPPTHTPAPSVSPAPDTCQCHQQQWGMLNKPRSSLKLRAGVWPIKCFVTTTSSVEAVCYYLPWISTFTHPPPLTSPPPARRSQLHTYAKYGVYVCLFFQIQRFVWFNLGT